MITNHDTCDSSYFRVFGCSKVLKEIIDSIYFSKFWSTFEIEIYNILILYLISPWHLQNPETQIYETLSITNYKSWINQSQLEKCEIWRLLGRQFDFFWEGTSGPAIPIRWHVYFFTRQTKNSKSVIVSGK